MTKAAAVGQGSIDPRHALILNKLGPSGAVGTRQTLCELSRYATIEVALQQTAPEPVNLASETPAHIDGQEQLANNRYQGMVVVEKPLFMTAAINRDQRSGYTFHPEKISAAGLSVLRRFLVQ